MMTKQKSRYRENFRLMCTLFSSSNLGSYLSSCAIIASVTSTQIDPILGSKFCSHSRKIIANLKSVAHLCLMAAKWYSGRCLFSHYFKFHIYKVLDKISLKSCQCISNIRRNHREHVRISRRLCSSTFSPTYQQSTTR